MDSYETCRVRELEGKPVTAGARNRRGRGLLWAALIAGVVIGCKQQDPEACNQALTVTRDALKSEQFDLAKQWRDRAWKQCEDQTATRTLDGEIVAKQSEVQQRVAAVEARKKDSEKLVALFASWAGEHRASADRAAAQKHCDEPAQKTKPKERWCTGQRALVGSKHQLQVRFWEDDVEAARFTATAPNATTCAALGPHKTLGSWQVATTTAGKTVTRTHCEFTSGALSGLHALVNDMNNGEVQIFSAKYLEKDPGFRSLIKQ